MLDTDSPTESTESAPSSAPATRRRRAATRPAGAARPETAPQPTVAEEAPAEAKSELTPKRRRVSTKADTPAATRRRKVAVAADAPQAEEAPRPADETSPAEEAPAKPVRRRATRKTASPTEEAPAASVETPAATVEAAPAEVVAEAPVKAPAKRRRATRPAAKPAVEEVVEAAQPAPEPAPVTREVQASVDVPETADVPQAPAPAPRRRRATRPAAAPVHAQTPTPVVEPSAPIEVPPVATEVPPAVEEQPVREQPARRRRATRAAAAPVPPAEVVEPEVVEPEVVEPEVVEPVAAVVPAADFSGAATKDEAPTRSRRRRASRPAAAPEARVDVDETDDDPIGTALKAAEDLAEARRSVLADPFMTAEARAAELAALAGAIAADDEDEDTDEEVGETPAAVEDPQTDDEESGEDEASEDDADDDRPARRRRRRGGRRRRKGGSEGSEDDSAEASEDADENGGSDGSAGSEGNGEDAERGEAESVDDNGSTTRRRRRRRRRESDGGGSSDDEVTGIEGSTRMEAKRQRRKESRAAGRRRAPILSEAEFLARRESVDRKLVIRQSQDYTQLVVIEDDVLVEHYVDKASATSLIGNIYLGKVQNVLPSMEASFIDIGRGRNAVLYAGEVDWAGFGVTGGDRKVENVLKSGQSVLVQVTKDPVGAKGARLTSHISLPGRYIVYSPGGHLSGISRKLPEGERQRLRTVLGHLISEDESVIVRTAAEGVSEDELVRDVNRLKAQWEVIEKKSKTGGAPQALYAEPDLTLRIVRDLFTEDFGHLIVQGNGEQDDAFDAISAYVGHVAPHLIERVERFTPEDGGADVFARFRVDEQIAKALDRKVYLPSGGSLVIDRTEAMTVVDVNTGRFTGSAGNLEATVTSNNLEAAEEIVRQLRLRDLGGIIVIDFIDMVLPSNRDLLLRRLVECLSRDRTRHQVAEVTSLGLVQLTRKKIGTGLQEAFTEECDHCHGAGYLRFHEPVDSQAPADGGERKSGSRRRRK